jgi:DNA-binding transcriptional regulator YhcF (GntR family)
MFPDLKVDKSKDTPVYRQILEKITGAIKNGDIKPGDRLPPERDLALSLGIARGTIKKAYEELARNHIIDMNRGRGTFVSFRQDTVEPGRKERATRRIDELLTELEAMRFSYREIKNLIDIKILEREERIEQYFIAAVDCNPESLDMYRKQLGFISRLEMKKILLDELARDPHPEKKLSGFELILSTSTHYSELIGLVPSLRERIVQVVVSPSQETVIDLAGLGSRQRIGILCQSKQFLQIIRTKLKDFHIHAAGELLLSAREDVAGFIGDKDVVIVPPGYSFEISKENKALIQGFTERGGKVVYFDYRIERGSLLYLEERIKGLLEK